MFPTYPACALEKRVQGIVRIKATLNADGRVIQAIPVGDKGDAITFPELRNDGQFGYESLCQAAQKAASCWEFAKGKNLKEIILWFYFELLDGIPIGEDLDPIYIPPFEIRIRGLLPATMTSTNSNKK
jgi:hypothetical protein